MPEASEDIDCRVADDDLHVTNVRKAPVAAQVVEADEDTAADDVRVTEVRTTPSAIQALDADGDTVCDDLRVTAARTAPIAVQDLELDRCATAGGLTVANESDAPVAVQVAESKDDKLIDEVCLTNVKPARVMASKSGDASKADAEFIDSGSDSSGSSSSSSSRSRSRRRNLCAGAVVATAMFTAEKPLDIDEADQLIEQELELPTAFAARHQHEGGMVAIMAETGAFISVSPKVADAQTSVLRVAGTAHAVGRAVSQLQLVHREHDLGAGGEEIVQVEVPADRLGAVVGPNQAGIAEIRAKCGGVMIAMMPPEQPGASLTAYVGPGRKALVEQAAEELRQRIMSDEAAAPTCASAASTAEGCGGNSSAGGPVSEG